MKTITASHPAIRIEGGLLSAELFTKARHYDLPGQGPADYGVEPGLKLSDELGRYWRIAQARWERFSELRQRADLDPAKLVREELIIPLLAKALGHRVVRCNGFHKGERHFPIQHTLCDGAVPLILAAPDLPLDKGDPAFGEEGHKRSPAALAQEFLNAEENCLWALASNGLVLRLLRDNPAMTRPAYLEVDLQRLFEEELFVDFTLFWLLLHTSRLQPRDTKPDRCWLEQWRAQGQQDGERVLGELRHGVTQALRDLGTGFVSHPDNNNLRTAIQSGDLTTDQLFQQLLRLVYRLLFLLTAGDRDLLLDPKAPAEARRLYEQGYAIDLLRERARKRRHHDRHGDAWEQLQITFAGFAKGQSRLGQPALGGLFSREQCRDLDKAALANRHLFAALFRLSFFESRRVLVRINYRDMDSEELGSVYESLLELTPRIQVEAPWRFGFVGDELDEASAAGHQRKLTGSYYTPDALVQELIKSALEPVIKQRLKAQPEDPRAAILSIRVCDPAAGSGHFLLAAARRLAAELARINAGADQPTEADYRHALREVVRHCIYGVDINPLAVELCRTALWLEAIEPGKPLGFLDAHIQVGNSVVGLLDPALLEGGIPDAAYKPLTGDHKETCKALKKRNKINPNQQDLFAAHHTEFRLCAGDLAAMPEEDLHQIEEKRQAWRELMQGDECSTERLRADLFTAAFFMPKTPDTAEQVPANPDLARIEQGGHISPGMQQAVAEQARSHRFFHWYLAFPEVFEAGGFDVMLGNPPWEQVKLKAKEFFASRNQDIVDAKNASIRSELIAKLASGDQQQQNLFRAYQIALYGADASSNFAKFSGRFPFSAKGNINLYALFAELFSQAIVHQSRSGVILPTGIATDESTKEFFNTLVENHIIYSLFDYENREKLFPAVDSRMKFCLLTIGENDSTNLGFFATRPELFKDSRRCFSMTPDDFSLINPNTKTCPVFRTRKDAELTKKIYRVAPVLVRDPIKDEPEVNPWGVTVKTRLFHMAEDSHLFFPEEQENTLPLYEAKMVHHYDHRWATYEADGETSRDCTLEEKQNPDYRNHPRYWVSEWDVTLRTARVPKEVLSALKKSDPEGLGEALRYWAAANAIVNGKKASATRLLGRTPEGPMADTLTAFAEEWPLTTEELQAATTALDQQHPLQPIARQLLEARRPRYLLGWRDITNATNERTVIAGVIPFAAVGDTFLLMFPNVDDKRKIACLLADQSSLVHDFVARQKIGGTHLKYHVKKQIVNLAPEQYDEQGLAFIVPRVLELTYTAHDLKPFADDLGYDGPPFPFDPERRHQLKSELDAYYALLYGLTRDELRYILDPADVMGPDYPSETFRVLKNREINEFGEYRTQRLVLEAWDRLTSGELR
jgi:hypothetical protein